MLSQHHQHPYAQTSFSTRNNSWRRTETGSKARDPEPDCLPQSVQMLIQLIGTEATTRVLQHFGGRSIYIPKRLRQSCTLLKVLQRHELQTLMQHYGGETVDLPQAGSLERHWRNLAIAAASAAGMSRAELVDRYGLSQRQIGNIRRRYRGLIQHLSEQPASVASAR